MKKTLLLFDIDGTLLDTRGAGADALWDAAESVLEVRREEMPPLDLAGATDSALIRKLFADAGRTLDEGGRDRFYEAYLTSLEARLSSQAFVGTILPGVDALLAELSQHEPFVLGLLTGNVRRGAELKLGRFDLARYFLDGGFGDDAEHRNDIGPVAVRRLCTAAGLQFAADEIVVLGDTPKDIACAAAIGARCIAVATGRFTVQELQQHSPTAVLADLSDASLIYRHLA
jgi:phosphoglycolate phosphatase